MSEVMDMLSIPNWTLPITYMYWNVTLHPTNMYNYCVSNKHKALKKTNTTGISRNFFTIFTIILFEFPSFFLSPFKHLLFPLCHWYPFISQQCNLVWFPFLPPLIIFEAQRTFAHSSNSGKFYYIFLSNLWPLFPLFFHAETKLLLVGYWDP
jgi:hypothetical protein